MSALAEGQFERGTCRGLEELPAGEGADGLARALVADQDPTEVLRGVAQPQRQVADEAVSREAVDARPRDNEARAGRAAELGAGVHPEFVGIGPVDPGDVPRRGGNAESPARLGSPLVPRSE